MKTPNAITRTSEGARLSAEIGSGVVLAIAIGALPAALVGLDLAWIVVTASVSLLIVAPVLAAAQVRGLDAVARKETLIAHAGRAVPLPLTIRSSRTARHVVLEVVPPSHRSSERSGAPRVAMPAIRAGTTEEMAIPTRLSERGVWSGLRLRTRSSWPFGLFTATRRIALSVDVTVLPRIMPRVDPAVRALTPKEASGIDDRRTAPRRGARGLPAEIRPARAGDTARDLAWRASVRHGRWLSVDRPSSALEQEVDIVLVTTVRGGQSLRRSSYAFESAVAHCATTVEWLTRRGARVRLDVGDGEEIVDSARALPHLRRLTIVARTESVGPIGRAMREHRRGDHRLRITFVPLSPLDFQRAVEAHSATRASGSSSPHRRSTRRASAPSGMRLDDRDRGAHGHAITLGVEAGGRIVTMGGAEKS